MDQIIAWIGENSHHAFWVVFCLLLGSGLFLPISSDLVIFTGGIIARRCVPHDALLIYLAILFGAHLAAWEGYWIGRFGGGLLSKIPLVNRVITNEKIESLSEYYAKYGIWTFIVGRWIPGGFRQVLFVSSGVTKMPFLVFALRDFFALLIFATFLFFFGYLIGNIP